MFLDTGKVFTIEKPKRKNPPVILFMVVAGEWIGSFRNFSWP